MIDDSFPTRRAFLARIGSTGLAIAAFGLTAVACAEESRPSSTSASDGTTPTTSPPKTEGSVPGSASSSPSSSTIITEVGPADWARVDLGFVSAYVLTRGNEAAVVDTGTSGSAPDIEEVLSGLGLDWTSVGHVIVTHSHGDHAGSLNEVMTNAGSATAYAGAADIRSMTSPRPISEVGDGDQVFGLDIIFTPGHTPGHISVLDPASRLLLAGDALNGESGKVAGPNRQFSANIATANDSARKLAELEIDTMVFGHGEPVLTDAGDSLRKLIETL